MYTHKQAIACVHVDDCIRVGSLHAVRTEHESSEYPTAMHVTHLHSKAGPAPTCKVLLMRSRDCNHACLTTFNRKASAGETGPPVPGVKPENVRHMTWPKTKLKNTRKYHVTSNKHKQHCDPKSQLPRRQPDQPAAQSWASGQRFANRTSLGRCGRSRSRQ